jgi:WD40 repeat protein
MGAASIRRWIVAVAWIAILAQVFVGELLAQSDTSRGESDLQPILAVDSGGHTGWVSDMVQTYYRDQIISVCHDKTIRFWDIHTGEALRVLRPPIGPALQGRIYAVAISPDGALLAVAGDSALLPSGDQRILLISLPEGQMVRTLNGHTGPIRILSFSPDGKQLASGSDDRTVRVWTLSDLPTVRTLTGHTDRVYGVAWSPDSRQLVSGSWDNTGRIWSAATGATQSMLQGHTGGVMSVAWSRDGRTIATCGGFDRSIRLWDANGRFRNGFYNLDNSVSTLAMSEDGRQLVYGWGSREHPGHGAAVLDLQTGREKSRFSGHLDTPMTGLFLSGGEVVATGGPPGDIYLWNTSTGQLVNRLGGRGSQMIGVGWSPDGRAIGWGSVKSPGNVVKGTVPLQRSFCLSTLDFGPRPDGNFIRAQGNLGNLHLERTKHRVATVSRNGGTISQLSIFNPDDKIRSRTLLPGDRAALGCSYGLFIYDVNSGRPIYKLPGHTDTVWGLAPSPDGRYLLSASGDQTLEIWNIQRYELVVSLFFAGDEWIAWTPQGYYAASVAGESLMGWQVNHGPEQMASFYPASQFHKTFYRPDVIRRLIETGSPLQAVKLADQQRVEESRPIMLSAALPPTVTITTPDERATTQSDSTLKVTASAQPSGQDAVTSMRLLIDGRPFETRQFKPNNGPKPESYKAPALEESWTVTLTPGTHQIAVQAETNTSAGVSEPVEVTYAADKVTLPRLFVLAIGVSEYSREDLRLQFAAQDAKALAAALKTHSGPQFREVLTHVLTDRQATRTTISEGFAWLKQHCTPSDVAVVFFAGQGVKDQQGVLHLLAADAQPETPSLGGVDETQIKQSLQQMRGRIVMILDAHHAASERSRIISQDYCSPGPNISETENRSSTDDFLRELVTDEYGVVVVGASTGSEASQESQAWGHSALVRAILDGLAGPADSNSDGVVHWNEMERYISDRVKELTAGRQHPVTGRPAMIRSFPVGNP